MIEVTIDSVRVSLMSQHRVIVLKDVETDRYLPIWIGPFEADAITIQLQGVEVSRPLTHDLLRSVIEEMGATVSHIIVSDLRDDTFFARIIMDSNGRRVEIDSRPSDAIALAIRVDAPVFVAEKVMQEASIQPGDDSGLSDLSDEEDVELDVFRDFVDTLDLSDLEDE